MRGSPKLYATNSLEIRKIVLRNANQIRKVGSDFICPFVVEFS
ncbi:hypothetical protein LEP1GSC193_2677 [Leptospira alstonii serovar Pingchang str. 80-412]|uniref:Uncharacterized protein n=2 Tax=Leptospira alstonii TaxID=28452 RepID=M6CQF4_9LEPT|nr:hypothetical protein LEP1GSC194_0184 [Leptospira alstonii serovar Sichuan str. 79601]EQA79223.1 hypothetical protein LEP1GSC193_2677 [Leptospira alstonii serovar Pingchang str. 80-412]